MRLSFTAGTFDTHLTRKMYSVGIPATLNLALPSLLISCLNIILSVYSQVYVLVLGVYYKLQTFLASDLSRGLFLSVTKYARPIG